MHILDLFESDDIVTSLPQGYSSEEDDQTVLKLSDIRKTRLTLGQLNKLRMLNDIRKLEHEQSISKLAKQYKPSPEGGGSGLM